MTHTHTCEHGLLRGTCSVCAQDPDVAYVPSVPSGTVPMRPDPSKGVWRILGMATGEVPDTRGKPAQFKAHGKPATSHEPQRQCSNGPWRVTPLPTKDEPAPVTVKKVPANVTDTKERAERIQEALDATLARLNGTVTLATARKARIVR